MKTIFLIILSCALNACASFRISTSTGIHDSVRLPYFKNSSNECYYLDEFMPVPDSLVAGKHGRLNLRYYTYNQATYKELANTYLVLSFYSQDNRCWSLFEERYLVDT